ncbi:60S ribosomal protein L2, mitochondrial isoform X2 [Lotus japonicus]|uniref:60S ribosomal protein L2, mitochondrial isoform X2 n=1 Tax=Lotus japonicus TaxID=34305 RepID=UPI00258A273E|nr:60S ribosomal protein L2, mitochondrial isoform X2 [Lotus japonicus]
MLEVTVSPSECREERAMAVMKRALRQFTFGAAKTAGRNSQGRITSFHRGGGAKRLQRTVDLKRNTTSSVGVVERIEYDPNRSSHIALVRWLNGIHPPQRHTTTTTTAVTATTTTNKPSSLRIDPDTSVRGVFALNSMLPPVGTASGNVFLSTFGRKPNSESEAVSMPLGLPRIAVAAARPAFFAPRVKGEEELEVRNWKRNSNVWAHRNKRKAAISWHNI